MKNAFLVFVTIALLPSRAFAVDGVMLINQSTVMAAGGFPYIIAQPGSYRLSGNLIVPNTNTTAIEIDADNVTIDLNGFAITGPLPCFVCFPGSGDGVFSLTRNNITIKNGYIKGVGHNGVSLGLTPSGNIVPGTHGHVVEGLRVESAGAWGIAVGENSTVRHNVATGNGFDGILMVSGVVESNVSSDNGRTGILAEGPVTVVGNFCIRNTVLNISLAGQFVRAHNFCSPTPSPCPDGSAP